MGIEQLPFLLQLLDDESPVVQEELTRALNELAPLLPPELERLEVSPAQRDLIHQRLGPWRARRLQEAWPRQWEEGPDYARLEQAQAQVSEYLLGLQGAGRLEVALDRLADSYTGRGEPEELAHFLFVQRLLGDSVDYYNPLNSSLLHVLQRGRGNPISLCCIFMLVGHRIGLRIEGSNQPGHFLAVSGAHTFDCFRHGRAELQGVPTCTGYEVVVRVLRNLVGAFQRTEQPDQAHLFGYLLSDMQARQPGQAARDLWPEPLYPQGQLVRHAGSNYRGVVVHYDLGPGQPRYYVLVHRSNRVAEASQADLQPDTSGPVAHGLVNYFFNKFEGGRYFRNGRPWEG